MLRTIPRFALVLGLAGLLPQAAALWIVLSGDTANRFSALATGYAYAALIFSFAGGMWWGTAAAAGDRAPRWLWVAAVLPSLIALLTAIPWAIGDPWPGPSLRALGLFLIGALGIDWRLHRAGLVPRWWMGLRSVLSIGLGAMTFVLGALA